MGYSFSGHVFLEDNRYFVEIPFAIEEKNRDKRKISIKGSINTEYGFSRTLTKRRNGNY
jgi:hypothetical protein